MSVVETMPEQSSTPSFFDKSRLLTAEFARYIYKGAGGTRDMNLAGYKRAIDGVIIGTEVKDVKFAQYSYEKVNALDEKVKSTVVNLWVSVVVSVRMKSGQTFEAAGDANLIELSAKHTENAMVRIAESRARKRAYAQALGISPEDFIADKNKKSRMEDIDTPLADLLNDDEDDGTVTPKESEKSPEKKPKRLSLDDLTG